MRNLSMYEYMCIHICIMNYIILYDAGYIYMNIYIYMYTLLLLGSYSLLRCIAPALWGWWSDPATDAQHTSRP